MTPIRRSHFDRKLTESHLNKIKAALSTILERLRKDRWYLGTRNIKRGLRVPKVGDVIRNMPKITLSASHRKSCSILFNFC